MKVTYNWLKDFVEIKISAQALAEKLTMAGLEVTSLEERDGDFVFEIEVTSNRPDCLNVIGIAREVAAITGKSLSRYPVIPLSRSNRLTGKQANGLTIHIENKKDCSLYTAKVIRDVKVGPSPDWLRRRLELVGCRSVNNIVDITNYILFTYGEPLHAFDLDKIVNRLTGSPVSPLEIIIRRAKEKEEIVTIDGIERILNEEILIIAAINNRQAGQQANRPTGQPIAIAGIMGGKDTEVTEVTKNILLEAAIFNPITIRRARQKLGVQSESSYRFERGIDLEIVDKASWQAAELIQRLAGGTCVLTKASGLTKTKKKNIALDTAGVRKILGVNIAPVKIKKILNSLAFKTKVKTKNIFMVEVPSYRPDVSLEIDLIEEIARIYGFAQISQTLPRVSPHVTTLETRDLVSLIKNILAGLGLNEVITYSLIDKDALKDLTEESASSVIEILNPLSKEQEILRPTLLTGLLSCVALNLNQKQSYLNIFEIAKAFSQGGVKAKEELVLGIALCGTKSLLLAQGLIKEEVGLLHLKGILEALFARLGINNYNFNSIDKSPAVVVYIDNETIGTLRQLPRAALERFEIKNKDVFALEISLDRLLSRAGLKRRFAPLPIYPAVSRDISLVLKEGIRAADILEAIRDKAGPLLQEVKITDYYKGKQIPAGFKGLTISCLYRSDERTLTEAEVNPIQTVVGEILAERFGAKIRT